MASSQERTRFGANNVQPYRIHVSQKYLDLTRQKLELTRLPHEPIDGSQQQQWNLGRVGRAELEPLVDYWAESYDWRAQEAFYNDALPQFRATINRTRLHFVHKRSESPHAVPLLFVQGWPESFISVAQVINELSSSVFTPGTGQEPFTSFHVVAPSIPGCGFSDAVPEQANNMQATAAIFDTLMKGLGYNKYISHGSGWGFKICRLLALGHHDSCVAIHTVNPDVPPRPNYGLVPEDPQLANMPRTPGVAPPQTPGIYNEPLEKPQTTAYALADSPAGLLAYIMEAIRPPSRNTHTLRPPSEGRSSISSRSPSYHSPQLVNIGAGQSPQHQVGSPQVLDQAGPWTPAALITWTMIYWLPGPEMTLRWLVNSSALAGMLWASHSNVPIGVTHFREGMMPGTGTDQTPPEWTEAYHNIVLMRRREGRVRFPAWERPAEVIMDIRELAHIVFASARTPALPHRVVPSHTWPPNQ